VEGPHHTLAPEEVARFTIRITPKNPKWKFRYHWTLTHGQPLTGQGTDTITVRRPPGSVVDATVDIAGGPDDSMCPVVSTERATWKTVYGEEENCPTIHVSGPAGIPKPGELIPYIVQLTGNVPENVGFRWSVSSGKVIEGQGTDKVKIDADWMSGVSVTATVEVLGLPAGCPNTSSETMAVAIDPGPIYVGSISEAHAYRGRINELIGVLEKYPNSQGYIFIGSASSDRYKQVEQLIRATASQTDFDQSRLTINREVTSKELIELWVIRPGVANPICKSCEDVACPRIWLNGPAGYIAHGMATIFAFNADLPNLENLKYQWTVTAGNIDQGQGTPVLYLITNNEDGGKELKVKVRVTGLPEGCPDTAEFVYGKLQFEGDAFPWDEWGRVPLRLELERLDLVAAGWKQNPANFFYIILYRAAGETAASEAARMKRIRNYLVTKKRVPAAHIILVSGGDSDRHRTLVYMIPPGADKPTP
jgi:hypothetical protein